MKTAPLLLGLSVFILGSAASAQVAIPTTPKNFTKRPLSSTSSNGAGISIGPRTNPIAPAAGKVRYTSHVAVCPSRQWQSTDGKSLVGKLIAFEDIIVDTAKGAPAPTLTPPPNPTVVKNGKVRMLVDTKAFEIELTRLSEADRAYVDKVIDYVAKTVTAQAQAKAAGK